MVSGLWLWIHGITRVHGSMADLRFRLHIGAVNLDWYKLGTRGLTVTELRRSSIGADYEGCRSLYIVQQTVSRGLVTNTTAHLLENDKVSLGCWTLRRMK